MEKLQGTAVPFPAASGISCLFEKFSNFMQMQRATTRRVERPRGLVVYFVTRNRVEYFHLPILCVSLTLSLFLSRVHLQSLLFREGNTGPATCWNFFGILSAVLINCLFRFTLSILKGSLQLRLDGVGAMDRVEKTNRPRLTLLITSSFSFLFCSFYDFFPFFLVVLGIGSYFTFA